MALVHGVSPNEIMQAVNVFKLYSSFTHSSLQAPRDDNLQNVILSAVRSSLSLGMQISTF